MCADSRDHHCERLRASTQQHRGLPCYILQPHHSFPHYPRSFSICISLSGRTHIVGVPLRPAFPTKHKCMLSRPTQAVPQQVLPFAFLSSSQWYQVVESFVYWQSPVLLSVLGYYKKLLWTPVYRFLRGHRFSSSRVSAQECNCQII